MLYEQKSIFSKIDIKDAYLQLALHPDSYIYAGLCTIFGNYMLTRMYYGYRNSGFSLECAVYHTLPSKMKDNKEEMVFNLADDLILASDNMEMAQILLKDVLALLDEANFSLNPAKCQFFMTKVEFIGNIVFKAGL